MKYVNALFVVLLLFSSAVARAAQTREATVNGITQNLNENYQACNEENMDRLLQTMSEEMPNRRLFKMVVTKEWAENDTYNRLEKVELLSRSNAPRANCSFPYATALVTQTVIKLRIDDKQDRSVFRQSCRGKQCDSAEIAVLANKMGINTVAETTRLQMLFKFEGGEWKLIAHLTTPEPVDADDVNKPEADEQAQEPVNQAGASRRRAERSVFN